MSDKTKEIRSIRTPVKVETRDDGTIKSIVGYPIVYNKNSEDMGFIEKIAPGAATKALKKSDVRGLKNHDPSLIFARSGVNLTLTEDSKGVRMEATPIETLNFRETAKEISLGLLDGQSFGFTIREDKWSGLDTEKPTRTITEFDHIFDVGPVTYPAYQDTTVALRSMDAAKEDVVIVNEVSDKIINDFVTSEEGRQIIIDILSKRSDLSPKTNESDITEPDPMIKNGTDGNDDTLDRINQTIKRYEK